MRSARSSARFMIVTIAIKTAAIFCRTRFKAAANTGRDEESAVRLLSFVMRLRCRVGMRSNGAAPTIRSH
jgi:hypothetical protein